MSDSKSTPKVPSPHVVEFAEKVRSYIHNDVVGPYTAISPRHSVGETTMTVKDSRSSKILEVIVREK